MPSTRNYCSVCGHPWDRIHDRCPVCQRQDAPPVRGPYRIPRPTSATDTLRANAEADVADLLSRLIGITVRSIRHAGK